MFILNPWFVKIQNVTVQNVQILIAVTWISLFASQSTRIVTTAKQNQIN